MGSDQVASADEPLVVGRYAVFGEIASGGMATVHLGYVLSGPERGRTVAVKRLRPHFVKDREFLTMFLDEARIVARIRHPNVVATSEVLESDAGMFLTMEYVHGETLAKLIRTLRGLKEQAPPGIAARIVHDVLRGLHGAHETRDDAGEMLDVVHRDVSPQNVMVGVDGIGRVLDFGVAKAAGRAQVTREGQIKGKLAYMAPEQVRGQVDRRSDVFAASVVLWEALTARRLHEGLKDYEMVSRVVSGKLARPSTYAPAVSPELDEIVMRGLSAHPERRHTTAVELAKELVARVELASAEDVAAFCERLAREALGERARAIASMEERARGLAPSAASVPELPAAPSVPPPREEKEEEEERTTKRSPISDHLPSAPNPLVVPTPAVEIELDSAAHRNLLDDPDSVTARRHIHASPDSETDVRQIEDDADSITRKAAPVVVAPPPPEVAAPVVERAPPAPRTSAPAAAASSDMRPYLVALVVSALLALVGGTLGVRAILASHPGSGAAPTSSDAGVRTR